jgi:glutaminyl-tRNA synthetase
MSDTARTSNFLADIIEADLAAGRNRGRVVTRFPPEPNGFLHIGHAKSILLNFGLASRYGGRTHLRFDDTNPTTEEAEYVEAIKEDVRWLGCDWGEHLHFASDYFERMYQCAERLVREGKAYVDSQPQDARRRRASTSSAACAPASSRTAPACCGPGSTWRTPTCSCAIRSSTGSAMRATTAPATGGASTRCTTTPIRWRMPSRE